MRPYPSAIPVTAPSKRPRTALMPSTLSRAATKCISEVPGLPKQTSTPDPTRVRNRLSAPFMFVPRRFYGAPDSWSRAFVSNEGTQSGNGLADDQRVHLPCALVGVNRLGIGNETADVIVQ